jgi:hypothetical protein
MATKQPEVAFAIRPTHCPVANPRVIPGSGHSQCAVSRTAARCVAMSPHPHPFVRRGNEHPKVVQIVVFSLCVVPSPAKQPQVATCVRPTRSLGTAPRGVPTRRNAQRPINSRLVAIPLAIGYAAQYVASSYPRPFRRSWIELPKIVQIPKIPGRIVSPASKQPKAAIPARPGRSLQASPRHIPNCCNSNRPVDSQLPGQVKWHRRAAAHPCPFIGYGREPPKHIQLARIPLGTPPAAAKKPQIPAAISPRRRVPKTAGNVLCRRRTKRPIHSGLTTENSCVLTVLVRLERLENSVAPTHPRPLTRRWVVLPHVIQCAPAPVPIKAFAPKNPKVTAGVSPAHR